MSQYHLFIFKGSEPPKLIIGTSFDELKTKGQCACNADYRVTGWEIWSVEAGKIIESHRR